MTDTDKLINPQEASSQNHIQINLEIRFQILDHFCLETGFGKAEVCAV